MARGFKLVSDYWRVYLDDDNTPKTVALGEETPPGATVFHLKPLPFGLAQRMNRFLFSLARQAQADPGALTVSPEELTAQDELACDMVRKCLVGWSGLVSDVTGEEIAFAPEIVEMLPMEVVNALAIFLWRKSSPSADAALKNADSATSRGPKSPSGTATKESETATLAESFDGTPV